MRDEIKWMGRKEAFPLPYYRLTAHIWLPSRCQRGVSRCGIPENLHFCGGKARVSAKKIICRNFSKQKRFVSVANSKNTQTPELFKPSHSDITLINIHALVDEFFGKIEVKDGNIVAAKGKVVVSSIVLKFN